MKLKKGKFLGAIVLSLFLLASCRSLKNTNTLFQSEYDKFADTAKSVYVANGHQSSATSYRIKAYDLVSIKNLQNPEGLTTSGLSTEEPVQGMPTFKVNAQGNVNLPVIGVVKIAELTQEEAAKKIEALYAKSLLKDPIIEVTVFNYKVTLLGEVVKSGNFALERENIDLVELIGKSGGLLGAANARKVKIVRGDRKAPQIIYVDLTKVRSLASKDLILQNNDIIYIPAKRIYNVTEVVKNYSGIIQPAFLVVNTLLLIYTLGR